jgi:hypothetical protein
MQTEQNKNQGDMEETTEAKMSQQLIQFPDSLMMMTYMTTTYTVHICQCSLLQAQKPD